MRRKVAGSKVLRRAVQAVVRARETLNKSSMSRVAAKIVMIASRATQVVAGTTMPRSAAQRGHDFGATPMGTGFAGGLLRCAAAATRY